MAVLLKRVSGADWFLFASVYILRAIYSHIFPCVPGCTSAGDRTSHTIWQSSYNGEAHAGPRQMSHRGCPAYGY